MPKRKLANGHALSSGGSGDEPEVKAPTKKPYQPPRLSVLTPKAKTKADLPVFNFPKPSSTSATTQSSRNPIDQPKASTKVQGFLAGGSTSMPTPRDTPSAPSAPITSLSDDEMPVSPTIAKGKARAPAPVVWEDKSNSDEDSDEDSDPDMGIPSGSGTGASRQLVEHRLDDMSTQIQSINTQTEELRHETKEQFGMLSKGIEDLRVLVTAALAPPNNPVKDETRAPDARRMTNPVLTTELSTLIIKVCDGFQSRIGNKTKGDIIVNSQKKHSRDAFKAVTTVNGVPGPHPSFLDKNGRDDYFPDAFADPVTGYRQPFPNYDKPMKEQIDWVPTVLHYWKATVPHDTGPVSTALRNSSDEEILIRIHDGPWHSARGEWRDKKKEDQSPGATERRRSNARQEKRIETKVHNRSERRKEVEELMNPAYDWMFHPGMMSRNVSDDEGQIKVYRNEGHALWLTSYYEASDIATHKAKPQSRSSAKHEVVLVAPSIPQLLTGTRGTKKIVPIGLCAFSKKFRRANEGLIKNSKYLLNMSLSNAPAIGAFLDKYPKDESDSEAEAEEAGGESYNDLVASGDRDNAEGMGVFDAPVEIEENGEDTDTEEPMPGKPEEPEEELDEPPVLPQRRPKPKVAPLDTSNLSTPAPASTTDLGNLVIDPVLHSSEPSASGVPIPAPAPALVRPPTGSPLVDTLVMHNSWGNPVGADMPPPPEIPQQVDSSVAPEGEEPAKPTQKSRRKKVQPEGAVDEAQSQLQEDAPVQKKRGRPTGSKNKPKATTEAESTTETQNEPASQSAAPPPPQCSRKNADGLLKSQSN